MTRKTELIGWCGLYCLDCPSYTQTVANLAGELRKQLRQDKFDQYADVMAKMPNFKAFENYKQGVELLEAMTTIRCQGCKAGGWDGKCQIRQCVKQRNFKGCWQCDIFESCEKLKALGESGDMTYLKNLRKIKRHGPEEFVKSKSL
jgi:hypothetical protein